MMVQKIPSNASGIQYFGRWEKSPAACRCAQGATYIKANFTGPLLMADLIDSGNWWRVSIDDNPFRRFRPQGENTLLAEKLAAGKHKVLLVRSTEGYMGISEFRGFSLAPNETLLHPAPPKARSLEFIGDSITAGAKNDGPPNAPYEDIEDNDMAYGPQLARMLDAEYSILGKSGEGVIHNWDEGWPGQGVHTADRYPWTFYSDKKSSAHHLWNPQNFPIDGILISLGTNDFGNDNHQPTRQDFIQGYKNLLQTVRQLNPQTPIIAIEPVPAWLPSEARSWTKAAVMECKALGDNNLFFIPLNEEKPLLEAQDYAGDNTHPLKNGSKKIALYLKDKVAEILGW